MEDVFSKEVSEVDDRDVRVMLLFEAVIREGGCLCRQSRGKARVPAENGHDGCTWPVPTTPITITA